jgi:hypothetical protein
MRRFQLAKESPTRQATPAEQEANKTRQRVKENAAAVGVPAAAASSSSSSAVLTLEQILAQHAAQQASQPAFGSAPASSAAIEPALLPPVAEFLSQLNRQLSILLDASSDAPTRKAAFELLSTMLRDDLPQSHAVPAYKAALKPLLKRFSDEREGCRTAAIHLVHRAVKNMPDVVGVLHFIVPVLAYRMGTIDLSDAPITLGANTTMHERNTDKNVTPRPNVAPPIALAQANAKVAPPSSEQSATVRTALLGVLVELLIRCTSHELEVFLPDLCQILYTSLQTDRAPETKLLVCDALQRLAEDYPGQMRAFAKILMLPLMQRVLLEKSSAVRVAGVRAMGVLIPCGAAEQIRDLCAFRENNVIDIHGFFHGEANVHYFARLVSDSNVRVRSEFFRVVNKWSLDLYERADYETLIMPYVFSGLSDSDATIRAEALSTLSSAGLAFEREEKERLASGVGGTAQDEGAFRLKVQAEEMQREYLTPLPHHPLLFPPFSSRPPWGQRQIARKFLDRLMHAVLQEKGDWKRDVAERSWTLLRVLLVYAEEHITQFCPAFLKAFTSEFLHLRDIGERPWEQMWNCMALVGRYTDPVILLRTLQKELQTAPYGEKLRSVVRTAAYMLEYIAYTKEGFEEQLEVCEEKVLQEDFLRCQEERLQLDLLHLLHSLVAIPVSSGYTTKRGRTRMEVLVKVAAWTRGVTGGISKRVSSSGSGIMQQPAGKGWSKDSIDEAHKRIDACYTVLASHTLRSLGETEVGGQQNLLLMFHLHLLPLTLAWLAAPAEELSQWTEASDSLNQLLEVLDRVGCAGVFEAGKASTAAGSTLTTEQGISINLEKMILRVLEENAQLSTHAALVSALAAPLRSAKNEAASSSSSSSTVVASSFTPSFLSSLRSSLSSRLTAFRAAHAALPPPSSGSLARLPREQELKAEAEERTRQQRREMMRRYEQAVEECLQAM